MTTSVLAVSGIALVILLRSRRRLLMTLTPRAQAWAALVAMLGFVFVPVAMAMVTLSGALSAAGGLNLPACGRLVWGVLTHPWARASVSLSLLVVAAVPVFLTRGALLAWRSQATCRRIARQGRDGILVVPTDQPLAFTSGLLRPRVVVSRGLLASTRADLHEVVLSHEEAHRRGRHPLLLFIAETLAKGLPLAPLRWGADALRYALEAIADDRAVRQTSDRALVAEAVASVALSSVGSAPAFEGEAVERVRRLLAPSRPVRLRGILVAAGVVGVLAFASVHSGHCAADSARLLSMSQCRLH